MKITKPKKNQILLEDDCFTDLDLEVKSKTGLNNSEFNEDYNGLVLLYRLPNMDASKHLFYGDKLSILTLLTGGLKNLEKIGVNVSLIFDTLQNCKDVDK